MGANVSLGALQLSPNKARESRDIMHRYTAIYKNFIVPLHYLPTLGVGTKPQLGETYTTAIDRAPGIRVCYARDPLP